MFVELVIMRRNALGENILAMSFPQTSQVAEDVTIIERFLVRYLETYKAEYKRKTGEELE